jgi:HPt (histidine-containing phosphotransfer) domain-containing protein
MIALFREEASLRLAALREAGRARDSAALRVAAHTLRGTAAAVGAHEVAELCASLERGAHDQVLDDIDTRLEALRDLLECACATLDTLGPGGATCAS